MSVNEENLFNIIKKHLESEGYSISGLITSFLDNIETSFERELRFFFQDISEKTNKEIKKIHKNYIKRRRDIQGIQVRVANDNIELEERINDTIEFYNKTNMVVSDIKYIYYYNNKTKINVFIAFIEAEKR